MFAASRPFTIPAIAFRPPVDGTRGCHGAEVAVFSFVGVLGIAIVLFFVVALTGRLILGR